MFFATGKMFNDIIWGCGNQSIEQVPLLSEWHKIISTSLRTSEELVTIDTSKYYKFGIL